jgi:hypothetical protein
LSALEAVAQGTDALLASLNSCRKMSPGDAHHTRMNVIDCLLDSDPAIHWQVMRDLTPLRVVLRIDFEAKP